MKKLRKLSVFMSDFIENVRLVSWRMRFMRLTIGFLFQLSQILEEIRSLKGSVGDRNIRIDVNPGTVSHVCR